MGFKESANGVWIRDAIDRFEVPLLQYAARVVKDADRARDIVQDTLLKLCDQDPLEIGSHLAQWLFTVCRNNALDVRRKESRMILLEDKHMETLSTPETTALDRLIQDEENGSILQMVSQLPENQQEVIRLKFQSGLSYREIAAVTQLSIGNVGFLIHSGLKALRSRIPSGTGTP